MGGRIYASCQGLLEDVTCHEDRAIMERSNEKATEKARWNQYIKSRLKLR